MSQFHLGDDYDDMPVVEATQEQGWAMFDARVRSLLMISGHRFLEILDEGRVAQFDDQEKVAKVLSLLPYVRG